MSYFFNQRTDNIAIGDVTFSGVRINRTSDQTIANASDEVLTWNGEDYDTDDYHDLSTNPTRLTAIKTGYHRISAVVTWANNSTGQRWLRYRVNGGQFVTMDNIDAVAGSTNHGFATDLFLNAGDYVEIMVRQDSGGNLNITSDSFATMSLAGV